MKKTELNYEVAKAVGDIDEKFYAEDYVHEKAKKISKNMLILVAIIGILTAGATTGAIYYKIVENRTLEAYSQRLGYSPEQLEVIQTVGTDVGVSTTDNGITLTVDAILGDEHLAMIVYSFTKEDGSPLVLPTLGKGEFYSVRSAATPDDVYWTGTQMSIIAGTGANSLSTEVDIMNIDGSDGSIQLIETIVAEHLPLDTMVSSSFTDILVCKPVHNLFGNYVRTDYTVIYEGCWEVEFLFSYGDSSEVLMEDEVFSYDGREIMVNSLVLSPFSLSIDFEIEKMELGDQTSWEYPNSSFVTKEAWADMNEDMKEVHVNLAMAASIPFYYTMKNGEKVELSGNSGGSLSSDRPNFETRVEHYFEEILPWGEIVSVTFGDMTVEVNL